MIKPVYTAVATATGGRNGHVQSDNGVLDLQVRTPKAMGGANDDYTNPEQIFAAGYSACFDSALNLVARQQRIKTGETAITAKVSIGPNETGGYGLAVELLVNIPGVNMEEAQQLADKAHQVCPYSNALRNNVEVKITVTNNEAVTA
ncbi:organic hydroperoxide resistance protein [Paracnuella aquatica]|uniref:organic hydroperoxide resistance protein n=1 Tax=Paracnuella aquatica TaxID=2268757 RepID=UPI001880DE03|nr:organic hydroperoxide resistance protein [Paracnuella aquatica]